MGCLWSPCAPAVVGVHTCTQVRWASRGLPHQALRWGIRTGLSFPVSKNGSPRASPGPSPHWGSRAGPRFLYWGPEGGSGRPGNFSGILGIRPFRGQGGTWKSPTRRGPWSRSPGLRHAGLDSSSSEGPAPVAFAELRAGPGWPLPWAWSLAGGLVCLCGVSPRLGLAKGPQVPERLARGSEGQVGQQEALGAHRVQCSCLSSAGTCRSLEAFLPELFPL